MSGVVHTEDLPDGCRIEIHLDDDPPNHHEDSPLGTIVSLVSGASWGDMQLAHMDAGEYLVQLVEEAFPDGSFARCYRQPGEAPEAAQLVSGDDLVERVATNPRFLLGMLQARYTIFEIMWRNYSSAGPDYLSLNRLGDPFERRSTGRVDGYYLLSHEQARAEGWSWPEDREAIEAAMRAHFCTYTLYLEGDCYGFVLLSPEDEDGDREELDSCWGYLGGTDDCLAEAKAEWQARRASAPTTQPAIMPALETT